jgi:serine/threonine protein kinase
VTILEHLRGHNGICQIYDYGTTGGKYWMVLRYYPMSLKGWRNEEAIKDPVEVQFKKGSKRKSTEPWSRSKLRTYLEVFGSILEAMRSLAALHVVHFDLKADNILLDHYVAAADQTSSKVAFDVCLADFGEALIGWKISTKIGRGTENIQSPELLELAKHLNKSHQDYDRRYAVAGGAPADVWALGCLFYELITNSFLFVEVSGAPIFLRVAGKNMPILEDEHKAALGHNPHLIGFLESILIRKVHLRPALEDVILKFTHMCHQLFPVVLQPLDPGTPTLVAAKPPETGLPSRTARSMVGLSALYENNTNTLQTEWVQCLQREQPISKITQALSLCFLDASRPEVLHLALAAGITHIVHCSPVYHSAHCLILFLPPLAHLFVPLYRRRYHCYQV